MRRARWCALFAGLALAGCYGPNPPDGAFRCNADNNFLCPSGLLCDQASGLCVHHLSGDAGVDASPDLPPVTPPATTCDDLVRAGSFSNLTNLGAVNGAGDEHSLTVSADGSRVYFLDGSGALETATISGKTGSAPQAVTVTGGPTTLNGGSLAMDGSYWFSGTVAGTTSLYTATASSPTALTVSATHQPSAACAFTDPFLAGGDPKGELYVSFPLAACGGAPMIAQGNADKNMGAFYAAFADPGFTAPSVTPGGLTLIAASTGAHPQLYYATRASADVQWSSATPLPMGALGAASVGDRQAIVSGDCKTLYLVANRAGGHGGYDLWVADIQ